MNTCYTCANWSHRNLPGSQSGYCRVGDQRIPLSTAAQTFMVSEKVNGFKARIITGVDFGCVRYEHDPTPGTPVA